jgi:Zn-dependent protease/CBS domain-containing protein
MTSPSAHQAVLQAGTPARSSTRQAPKAKRPGRLATIAGIDIYIHWSFVLLIAWIFMSHLMQGHGLGAGLEGAGFILAIFGCVLLHELGHALTAKRFGVRTRDITLYPIGGVARLERIPEKPSEELLVAIAGPAVNVVIAAVLFLWLSATGALPAAEDVHLVGGPFLAKLMAINIVLAVFNLIPAFPMDGGRVLRALLATRLEYVRATQYAATTGQVIAVLLGLIGLFGNWFLLFIAFFVFVGARGEAHSVQTRSVLAGVPVRAAMITRFTTLEASDTVERAVAELLSGSQQDFPVLERGRLIGVLPRDRLVRALAEGAQDASVGSITVHDCGVVDEREMLDAALARMQEAECRTLPVLRGDEIRGVLTIENIGEWLMVQSAHGTARTVPPAAKRQEGGE